MKLMPDCLTEAQVIEASKEVVGRSRQEVAWALMQRFGLKAAARTRMAEFGIAEPWQAFVHSRLRAYESLPFVFDFITTAEDVGGGKPDCSPIRPLWR